LSTGLSVSQAQNTYTLDPPFNARAISIQFRPNYWERAGYGWVCQYSFKFNPQYKDLNPRTHTLFAAMDLVKTGGVKAINPSDVYYDQNVNNMNKQFDENYSGMGMLNSFAGGYRSLTTATQSGSDSCAKLSSIEWDFQESFIVKKINFAKLKSINRIRSVG
jgi:hypothetical protein